MVKYSLTVSVISNKTWIFWKEWTKNRFHAIRMIQKHHAVMFHWWIWYDNKTTWNTLLSVLLFFHAFFFGECFIRSLGTEHFNPKVFGFCSKWIAHTAQHRDTYLFHSILSEPLKQSFWLLCLTRFHFAFRLLNIFDASRDVCFVQVILVFFFAF